LAADLDRIRQFVTALVRRERVLIVSGVLARLVGLAAVAALIAVFAHWFETSRSAGLAAIVIAVGVGGFVLAAVPLLREWRHTGDVVRQATLVEALEPTLRGRLLTSVERVDGPIGAESPALVGLVAGRAAKVVAQVAPSRVHSSRRFVLSSALSGALVLASLVVSVLAPGGPFGTFAWWFGSSATAAAADLAARGEPAEVARVGDLVITYTYPPYTKLEPLVVPNSTGEVHAPPGTVVQVVARAGEAVEAAALIAYEQPALDAEVSGGREVSGSFVVRPEPGQYRIVMYRGGIEESSRPFAITPEPDLEPEVVIVTDDDVLEVAVDALIELPWTARDDYGIVKVSLELDQREVVPELVKLDGPRPDASGQLGLRPGDLRLRPGDRAIMQVVAYDNDTVAGSKAGRSRAIEIIVLGAERLADRRTEHLEALQGVLIDILAPYLSEAWPPGYSESAIASWGEQVAGRYTALEALLASTDIAEDVYAAAVVTTVMDSGRELIRYTQTAFDPASTGRALPTAVDMTTELRTTAISRLEDGIIDLDVLVQRTLFGMLVAHAEGLQRSSDDLARIADTEADLFEVQIQLDGVKDTFDKMNALLPRLKDDTIKNIVEQRVSEMDALSEEIRKELEAERAEPARELTGRLSRQMQELIDDIQEQYRSREEEGESLIEKIKELEGKLAELEDDQRELQAEVGALRSDNDAASAKRTERKWAEIEELAQSAETAAAQFERDLDKAKRGFREKTIAADAASKAERLRQAVEARDLRSSVTDGNNAARSWQHAEDAAALEKMLRGGALDGPSEGEARGIRRDLEQALSLLEELLGESESVPAAVGRQVSDKEGEQEGLQARLSQLRQEAAKISQEMPVRPGDMHENLRDSDQQMDNARQDMRGRRPMPAEGSQGQAAERLREAREALEEARKRMMEAAAAGQRQQKGGGTGQGKQESDGGRDGKKMMGAIELSLEDEQDPDAYRRALLEGMEGDVPEEFRAYKKRYYEELVQH
jgi:predicted nuclease with TOPRIM domain